MRRRILVRRIAAHQRAIIVELGARLQRALVAADRAEANFAPSWHKAASIDPTICRAFFDVANPSRPSGL